MCLSIKLNDGDNLVEIFKDKWTKVYYSHTNKPLRKRFPDPSFIWKDFYVNFYKTIELDEKIIIPYYYHSFIVKNFY